MRRFVLAALFVLITPPCRALELWQTLPPTPAPIATDRSGMADANGIKIHPTMSILIISSGSIEGRPISL
jgi:hypothetical protein